MLNTARIVLFTYAVFLIIGGIAGYRAGSNISLIAGGVTGLLALGAALLLTGNPTVGLGLGLVTALLVGGSFLPRVLKEPNLFPGGVTLALSVLVLILMVAALLGARAPGAR